MSSSTTQPTQLQRQLWMSVMAKSPAEKLSDIANTFLEQYQFQEIRSPEIGLTQVRGRMGGTGSKFNLGDTTITRCVVRFGEELYGHSYIIGRNKQHALIAAKLDALLQDTDIHDAVHDAVIKPLTWLHTQQQQTKHATSQTTKVDFFTLVRGED